MDKWISFRAFQGRDDYKALFQEPRKISEHLTIRSLPEAIHKSEIFKSYFSRQKQQLEKASIGICAEYEASAFGDIQSDLNEKLALLPTIFWLAGAPLLMVDEIVHCRVDQDDLILRHLSKDSPIFFSEKETSSLPTIENINSVIEIYNMLGSINTKGTIKSVLWCVWRAIKEQEWPLRFMLHWICIEGLFGPKGGELGHRIAERMALFLFGRSSEAQIKYSQIKKSYDWRCKVVHGMHLSGLKPDKSLELMEEIEQLVRNSLVKVLSPEYQKIFDTSKREPWLDSLVFDVADGL